MRILNRLTIKHLLMNKKRTIVTIIGITLSMALMLGCGLLASSFIEQMKRDAIDSYGSHHVKFEHLDYDQANIVKNNINIKTASFYSTIGFAPFSDSANDWKPYYYIAGANETLLSSLKLLEGRLPQNENEVVISEHIIYNAEKNLHVGDTLSLNVGTRYQEEEAIYENKTYLSSELDTIKNTTLKNYQIVGIIERSYLEDYDAAGYSIFTYEKDFLKGPSNSVLVEFLNPKKTFEIGKEIKNTFSLNSNDVDYNDGLLYFYGTTRYDNVNQAILGVLSIALTILSIGCIIVIYNSFAISTMERKKQFGLYSSIGATKKQILHTVFFEAFVVGIIGMVLGIAGSFLGIYIVLQVINLLLKDVWNYEFSLVINWIYILVPIFFMILVIFFSALIPARRSSKVTPIEAIRENDDIKMPRRKLKTPKFVLKLFGIEGELALKNMKRNKKKYRITVLSLFVSIVLFITFSAYLTYGMASMDTVDYYDMDIIVGMNGKAELNEIRNDPRIQTSYLYQTGEFTVHIPFSSLVQEYADYRSERMGSLGKTDYLPLDLIILEDSDFKVYAEQLSLSEKDVFFLNEGQLINYQNDNRTVYHGPLLKTVPSEIPVCQSDRNMEQYSCFSTPLKVKPIDTVPDTFAYLKYSTNLTALLSTSTFEELIRLYDIKWEENPFYTLHIQSEEVESLYGDLKEKYKSRNYSVSSPKMELKEQKNVMLALKILLYGFISLVTLIGVTSVFNTIHTCINLRRKEFAMLRSMGLAPRGFNKMILFESLFFGLKSLMYGLPVSFGCVLLVHQNMSTFMGNEKILIPWTAVLVSIVGVFLVVLLAMGYSVSKIKKENILEAIREENI